MTAKEWLESERNYEAGRLLYQQLGDSDRLKLALARGDNFYNREALVWEITKLARAGVVTSVAVVDSPAAAAVVENATEVVQPAPVAIPAASPLLIELAEARRPLYDERTQLHGQLEVLAEHASQDDVRLAAVRIMALSRELNANWKADAHVREHGQLPPAPPAAPGLDMLTPAELLKKRNNLRSQASKLKKRSDRAEDLARVEALLLQVEILLNPAK